MTEQISHVDVVAHDGDFLALDRELHHGNGAQARPVHEMNDRLHPVDAGESELPIPGEICVVSQVGRITEEAFAPVNDLDRGLAGTALALVADGSGRWPQRGKNLRGGRVHIHGSER